MGLSLFKFYLCLMEDTSDLLKSMLSGNKRSLARCITIVENELPGYEDLLCALPVRNNVPVIGITGPPGAGKSTLINAILKQLVEGGKTAGIVAVDPSSPFTRGSLLGDRLRMAEHFMNDRIFIRSLASRGSLGGLSAKSIEITDVMRAFGFDMIILETVGVGQSEIEITGLADLTVLVLVPESGDDIQTLKAGVMEIADMFVVNKSDRPGADLFVKNLLSLVHSRPGVQAPVIKTIASQSSGITELLASFSSESVKRKTEKKAWFLAEKAYRLISNKRMMNVSREELETSLRKEILRPEFNLYEFISHF